MVTSDATLYHVFAWLGFTLAVLAALNLIFRCLFGLPRWQQIIVRWFSFRSLTLNVVIEIFDLIAGTAIFLAFRK